MILKTPELGSGKKEKIMLNVTQSLVVKKIDSAFEAEVVNLLTEVQPSADGSKAIGLNLESATGAISDAITLLDAIHKSDVDYTTSASGELDLATSILLAGGKPGERTADATATFIFFSDPKKAGKKRKTLSPDEENALVILKKLTSKKKSGIESLMLSGAKVTATQMLGLGLIDQVKGGFVDKYEQFRKVTKKGK